VTHHRSKTKPDWDKDITNKQTKNSDSKVESFVMSEMDLPTAVL